MTNTSHNPTTSIKCKFSNAVHRILEPNIDIKSGQRWKHYDRYKFTDSQKIQMFDEIMKLHKETSSELSSYLWQKRSKKRVQRERAARGYVPKKRTSLDQYKSMKKSA